MKPKQVVDMSVSDSANPIPMRERARPHAKGIPSSLPPYDTKACKAVAIDTLLHWAFAREKVHLARPPGLDIGVRLKPRGFAAQSSSERIGAAVGSSMNLGFEAPRDAYAVAAAVAALRGDAGLVREYALIGEAPDWTPYPVIWWERGPPIYGRDHRGRVGRRVVAYCVAARGDLDALVDERRAVYGRWAAGVAAVHGALVENDALSDHVLTQVLPPPQPWA
jgi:hypothetical protein